MKKFLLYALSLVCIAGVANAQQKSILLQPKQERKVHKVEALTNQAQKQKFERSNQHLSIITSENNLLSRADDLTWDYHLYNATSEDELSAVGAAGYKIRAAFEIDSATVAQLIGCKISQGYFGVGSNGRTSRFKPFIALGADELCDEPSLQLSSTKFTANAQTYVDFDFTIPDNSEYGPIYVGYEITNSESVGSTTYYPVLFDYYTYDYDPSMVLALWDTDEETGVEYWDAAYYGTYFGALWSGCIITGDLPTNEAELYLGMADPQAQVGDQVYITTYLYNSAANYINSVTYSTLVAEGTGALDLEELQSRAAATDEQTVTLDEPIAPLQGGYVTFIVPYTLDKVGSYTVALPLLL
ncbi:MAG: hypothetical protein LIO90_05890 [Bacteroidales bacterium]|nr:hypothetical protein [Bacteroidales bacterium]